MARTRREQQRERTLLEIKETARGLMREKGVGALSLGAIARTMGLTTPALYRYYENRNALITELVAEAYARLSEETHEAVAGLQSESFLERYLGVTRAYREWAIRNREAYRLIHGSNFPGYKAPVHRIIEASLGTADLFVRVLWEARRAGQLRMPEAYTQMPEAVRATLTYIVDNLPVPDVDPEVVLLAYTCWLKVHALVWQEIAGHLPPSVFTDGSLFRMEMIREAQALGLR